MHKYLLTVTIALSALMAGQAYAQQKYVFALVPKNMNNPFFDQARDGCKKAEAEAAVPDELVDEVALCGPRERIRERVAEYKAAGVTTLMVAGNDPAVLRTMAEVTL